MKEVRVAVAGNVDAGKTSIIACLTQNILDDGRGSARMNIFVHPHERETGRTSSVSKNHMFGTDKSQYVTFVDLAGHEKYLRTTMHGITGGSLDYGMILVGANMGVTKMTREHMSILVSLKIPIFIVVTKMDICPEKILEETLADIRILLSKTKRYQIDSLMGGVGQVNDCLNLYRQGLYFNVCPIFQISNKSGLNLDLLRSFVTNLPIRKQYVNLVQPKVSDGSNDDSNKVSEQRQIFRVESRYIVKGVGLVVSGKVNLGPIKRSDVLFIGPIFGQWVRISVKSIHDDFRNVCEQLEENQSGCLAFNVLDKKMKFDIYRIRKGTIVADKPYQLHWNFKTNIAVTAGHATTIAVGYQPVINCKTTEQTALVCSVGNLVKSQQKVIRCGDTAEIIFHFMHRPEFLTVGDLFVF